MPPLNAACVESFFDAATGTATHVVACPATRRAAVIDSVLGYEAASGRTSSKGADRIVRYVREHVLRVEWLLETHAHADHLSGAPYLQERVGGRIGIGTHIRDVQQVFERIFNAKEMNTD